MILSRDVFCFCFVHVRWMHKQSHYQFQVGHNVKFTLAPESVLRCVLHALESKMPKNHYRVTFPTKLFAFLCRILPSSWMDNILSRAEDGDKD